MSNPAQFLYLERIDPTARMARYYQLEIVRDLFGAVQLIRCWGRIGRSCQTKICSFDRLVDAEVEFQAISKRKQKRGYV